VLNGPDIDAPRRRRFRSGRRSSGQPNGNNRVVGVQICDAQRVERQPNGGIVIVQRRPVLMIRDCVLRRRVDMEIGRLRVEADERGNERDREDLS
jgi:hypothetical protein